MSFRPIILTHLIDEEATHIQQRINRDTNQCHAFRRLDIYIRRHKTSRREVFICLRFPVSNTPPTLTFYVQRKTFGLYLKLEHSPLSCLRETIRSAFAEGSPTARVDSNGRRCRRKFSLKYRCCMTALQFNPKSTVNFLKMFLPFSFGSSSHCCRNILRAVACLPMAEL